MKLVGLYKTFNSKTFNMAQYIPKDALVAEIERRIKERDFQMKSGCWVSSTYMYEDLLDFINTLEVKEANEALRTEYEKGRADVIAKTLEWINVFNDNNYIMQYSDSCEHPINEIIEWYKNYINRE